MTTNQVPVLAAVIRRDADVLLCQRPRHKRYGKLWEFPGGKILTGEDLEHAARRELREELGVEVLRVGQLEYELQDPGSAFLIKFVDVTIDGTPKALEHERIAWVSPRDLLKYDLAPADRAYADVLVEQFRSGRT
jgi:mutator protein MutT